MNKHEFECPDCGVFYPDDDYDDNPQTRGCLECHENQGKIKYNGYKGYLPRVISDSMGVQGVQSMADGKYYDSKSAYYNSLKSRGLAVQEAGMQTSKPKTEKIDWKPAVAEAIQQLKSTSPTRKGKKK